LMFSKERKSASVFGSLCEVRLEGVVANLLRQ
jgi:hypothetical protein